MKHHVMATAIGLGRLAFGLLGYAAPSAVVKMGPLPGLDGRDGAYMTRHWAVRDAAIGVLTIIPATRGVGLRVGAVVDACDVATGLISARSGAPARAVTATVGGAGAFAVAGFWTIRTQPRELGDS